MRKAQPIWISNIISAALIIVFVYAAASKLMDHTRFREILKESPIISNYATFFSWAIPLFEIGISALLIVPKSRKLGLWYSLFTMLVFTCYLGYMVAFIPNKPCSCGGILEKLSWTQHLAFNITLTIFAGLGLWVLKSNQLFIAIDRKSRIPV